MRGENAQCQRRSIFEKMSVTLRIPKDYLYGAAVVLLISPVAAIASEFTQAPTVLIIYMVAVVFAATKLGERASYFTCVFSFFIYYFVFVYRRHHVSQMDTDSCFSLIAVVLLTIIVSRTCERLRHKAAGAIEREEQTRLIYNMERDLANTRGAQHLASKACSHISKSLSKPALLFVLEEDGSLRPSEHSKPTQQQFDAARICLERKEIFRIGAADEIQAQGIYLPLKGSLSIIGVLAITGSEVDTLLSEQTRLLEMMANQAAFAIERATNWER